MKMYIPKSKEWFIERIGKRIYRDNNVMKNDWEAEFDSRFYNPAIPSPNELKIFIKKVVLKENEIQSKKLDDFKMHPRPRTARG